VGSPRAVAERSDIVITMLPDSPDVEDVVLGEEAWTGSALGGLLIDMSTVAPATAAGCTTSSPSVAWRRSTHRSRR